MQNRAKYLIGATRPQAMLWSNNVGTLDDGVYVPAGVEGIDFIILSDHNRSSIDISQERIETRQRMINANMRSYHIADKLSLSTSWQRLPSRPYDKEIFYNSQGEIPVAYDPYISYTVDGGAGGMDMLAWYESNPGSFYCYLSYDKNTVNGITNYNKLGIYNQIVKVYFSSFSYNVEKRSGAGFDFWNVNVSLDEV